MTRIFTEQNGIFQMLIPLTWEYKNPSLYKNDPDVPHSFQLYRKPLGGFQLSCKKVNKHIAGIILAKGLEIQTYDAKALVFAGHEFLNQKFPSYVWMAAIEDYFFLVTYIYERKDRNPKKLKSELVKISKVLSTIKLIKPEFRSRVAAHRRYELFMGSIAANIDLRNKAIESHSYLELIVLTANHIDAALRLSIIYTDQIAKKSREIDTSYLFQSEKDKPIFEREIYEIALQKEIITKKTFEELELLYKERNKVVHRYIITDIRTEDLYDIARSYQLIDIEIDEITNSLERRQFDLKVGIHGTGNIPPGGLGKAGFKRMLVQIRDKHGRVAKKTSIRSSKKVKR